MEPDETTAQDVIDALRLVLIQDDADPRLIRELVRRAPISDGSSKRGVQLLVDGIRDGEFIVHMCDPATEGSN